VTIACASICYRGSAEGEFAATVQEIGYRPDVTTAPPQGKCRSDD
jgi:hypothetical protein